MNWYESIAKRTTLERWTRNDSSAVKRQDVLAGARELPASWTAYEPNGAPHSHLPADHPAIVLQDNDQRSREASYFAPDEGGEA